MNLQQYTVEVYNACEEFHNVIRDAAEQFKQRVNNARVELLGEESVPEPSRPDKY